MAEVKITLYVPEGLGLGQQAERTVAGLPEWPWAAGKVAPSAGAGLVPSRLFLCPGMARGNVTWVTMPRWSPLWVVSISGYTCLPWTSQDPL